MLKKFGFGSIVVGMLLLAFGIWLVSSYSPFDYWGYSSGMRTIMEFFPWILLMMGAFGLIGGIFYLIQDTKPQTNHPVKIIEKNGKLITAEFNDGSRKNLTILGNTSLTVGDEGIVICKGNFIIDFDRTTK